MLIHIHKINGLIGKASLSVVLPGNFLKELQIVKGDLLEINKEKDRIVIKKLMVEKDEQKKSKFDNPKMDVKNNEDYCKQNLSLNGLKEKENEKDMIPVDNNSFEGYRQQVSIIRGID